MTTIRQLLMISAGITAAHAPAVAEQREPSPKVVIEPILERFVDDYAADPMAKEQAFGVEIDGHRWTVEAAEVDGSIRVTLNEGFAPNPMIYFTASIETLNLLDQQVWNGLTAMGAATSADETPLDVLITPGFERGDNYDRDLRRLIFHFWTRGLPEKVSTGPSNSRVVHGAPATVLYYDEGFRSAVYHVPAGLGREQAPTLAVPFPRMVVVTNGGAEGDMDGEPFQASTGEMLFIAPNIPVTFWNASDSETLSFVWLMWGEGA